MAEEKKLLEIENLRKYFPVNGIKRSGGTGCTGCFPLYQKR